MQWGTGCAAPKVYCPTHQINRCSPYFHRVEAWKMRVVFLCSIQVTSVHGGSHALHIGPAGSSSAGLSDWYTVAIDGGGEISGPKNGRPLRMRLHDVALKLSTCQAVRPRSFPFGACRDQRHESNRFEISCRARTVACRLPARLLSIRAPAKLPTLIASFSAPRSGLVHASFIVHTVAREAAPAYCATLHAAPLAPTAS